MVELKLNGVKGGELPPNCFVCVRVGSEQKLSKLTEGHAYNFPNAGSRRYGRVELFQRIGVSPIDLDPEIEAPRQVKIGGDDAKGFSDIILDMSCQGLGADRSAAAQAPAKEKQVHHRVTQAKGYLAKHDLELRLSEAMQALLKAKPDNPTQFLAEKLMSSAQKSGTQLPPISGSGAQQETSAPMIPPKKNLCHVPPEQRENVPPLQLQERKSVPRQLDPIGNKAPAAQKAPPTTGIVPLSPYYAANIVPTMEARFWKNIHAKFPANPCLERTAATTATPTEEAHVEPAAVNSTEEDQPVARSAAAAEPAAAEPAAAEQPAAELAAAEPQLAPAAQKAPTATAVVPLSPYNPAKLTPALEASGWANIYEKFPAKPRPGAPTAAQEAAAATPAAPAEEDDTERVQEAVVQGGGAAAFHQRPSVGTWLAPRLAIRPQQKGTPEKASAQAGGKQPGASKAPTAAQEAAAATLAAPAEEDDTERVQEGNVCPAKAAMWAMAPSVGTWIARPTRPKKVEPSFNFRPSVGTWLRAA